MLDKLLPLAALLFCCAVLLLPKHTNLKPNTSITTLSQVAISSGDVVVASRSDRVRRSAADWQSLDSCSSDSSCSYILEAVEESGRRILFNLTLLKDEEYVNPLVIYMDDNGDELHVQNATNKRKCLFYANVLIVLLAMAEGGWFGWSKSPQKPKPKVDPKTVSALEGTQYETSAESNVKPPSRSVAAPAATEDEEVLDIVDLTLDGMSYQVPAEQIKVSPPVKPSATGPPSSSKPPSQPAAPQAVSKAVVEIVELTLQRMSYVKPAAQVKVPPPHKPRANLPFTPQPIADYDKLFQQAVKQNKKLADGDEGQPTSTRKVQIRDATQTTNQKYEIDDTQYDINPKPATQQNTLPGVSRDPKRGGKAASSTSILAKIVRNEPVADVQEEEEEEEGEPTVVQPGQSTFQSTISSLVGFIRSFFAQPAQPKPTTREPGEQRGSGPQTLQEVVVPTVNHDTCQSWITKIKPEVKVVKEHMVCAGFAEGGKDSCQGDSGGPFVCQVGATDTFELRGATSWGLGCADKESAGVYARLSTYCHWIHQNICDNSAVVTKADPNFCDASVRCK